MSSLNRIVLVGSVDSRPELKSTNSGDGMLRVRLKVDRPSREGAETGYDFITVVLWRQLAEQNQSLKENDVVLVEGNIATRTFDTPEGKRKWVTEVEGREVRLISSPSISIDDPLANQVNDAPFGQGFQDNVVKQPAQTEQPVNTESVNLTQPVHPVATSSLEEATVEKVSESDFSFEDNSNSFSEEFSAEEENIPF
ncbi:single-stranded DNA-binding protein [Candidatus Woesearchaeota archaeon]|jgi:single-strand DNA-binding protein|nr:single-stranded DNA-binding protein [Candidatus Woesearchaeota archaeon]MBT6119848.1 single-stranded DNA-binding protein [bacterium]